MMNVDELASVEFLRQVDPGHTKMIASIARPIRIESGKAIFREGERSRDIFVVLDGEVRLEIRVPGLGEIPVQTVGRGELLGWSPALGDRPLTAGAHAQTDCRLAAIDVGDVHRLSSRDPKFGMEFFRWMAAALAERLHATRLQIAEARRGSLHALREAAD